LGKVRLSKIRKLSSTDQRRQAQKRSFEATNDDDNSTNTDALVAADTNYDYSAYYDQYYPYYWDGYQWVDGSVQPPAASTSASTAASTWQQQSTAHVVPDLEAMTRDSQFISLAEPVKKKTNKKAKDNRSVAAPVDQQLPAAKPIVRAAGGEVWEDVSLAEWDPNDFRIFVGDLGPDCKDEHLQAAFERYPTLLRVKTVRDHRNPQKCKGYGFVSFKSVEDYMKAFREMQGKFIAGRPVSLRKSNWKDRSVTQTQAKKIKKEYKWAKSMASTSAFKD
jgi:hypothetical protein